MTTQLGQHSVWRFRRREGPPSLAPFDEPVRDLLFGGVTPGALYGAFTVEDVYDDEPLPEGARIAIADDVVTNHATLSALLTHVTSEPVRAAIAPGTALFDASARLLDVDRTAPLAVPLWAGDLAGKTRAELESAPLAVVADEDGAVTTDARPYGTAPHTLRLANVEKLLGWPRHWLHVLDLSLAALLTRLRHVPQRFAGRAKVHPTAKVIRSVLGEGTVVEAGAAVVDSVIGDDVIIADHSVVHTSVIGSGCRTLVDTHLRRVVAMGGSTLSNLDMQDAVFGREVFLTTGVGFFYDAPGHDVIVDGINSGRALLGGAIGRRAVLGSRALMTAGTCLPAGALIVARPGEAAGKLDVASLSKANMVRLS